MWKYRWNGQGQLAELLTPERRRWRYEYDAFGRRIRKFEVIPGGGADERRLPLTPHAGEDAASARGEARRTAGYDYFWCGEQMVEETPLYADGTPADDGRIRWLYQPGAVSPFARYERGRLHYVVSDHLGSVRELLSEEGKAVWFARSTTWGRSRLWGFAANDEVRAGCQWRFPGQYEDDESGLHYNRFRYYDPDTAQYISPDPIGLAGGINLYAYVKNPLTWIDPLGLAGCQAPNKKTTYEGSSRRDAFRQAKRDAGIPMNQQPKSITRPDLLDGSGNKILNNTGQPIKTRQYEFTNSQGKPVFIQEHSLGHAKATPLHGAEPHFNVRSSENLNTGSVSGTHGHYNF
ncbi:HNH/endonuclease VII fold putative polymorphic toxin [Erwinia sorbitola]|uniref:RHS repeat protein n=1 Tax=Erwinia sorbitola TaxID=2681984 RepID=A0A6I6EE66_9GAMM|nr:HNH/endonuclease VII fold putative polymorphic toxin [Erwinia sorbitola]QGU88097.1 RHS repeat protein [Erwinia sorbitola]